jgi:pyruvate formate lyase activating enzyme
MFGTIRTLYEGEKMGISDSTGLVVDVERFSTQNGPGIRTTVFLKGCPLRCDWCCNPETQSYIPEIMVTAENCVGCGECVDVCPNKAIELVQSRVSIDFKRCLNCLKCTEVCSMGGIRKVGNDYTREELFEAVCRDKEFYGTRGGVTFTGGEPLSQWEFLLPVLEMLHEQGIGVCMDTTGYVDWSVLEKAADYVDIFLYDVKHLDSRHHREGTGVGNELILENLRNLASIGARIWLRAPIIPGFNDSDLQVRNLACLARELDVERLCLMPYHTLGREKYRQLGRIYSMGATEPYASEEMDGVREIAEKYFSPVFTG